MWTSRFHSGEIVQFYGSRYFRIIPLYMLSLLLSAALVGGVIKLPNLTLLGVASQDNDPTGISWSLDIELQFYLILPLVVWIVTTRSLPVTLAIIAAVTLAGWTVGRASDIVSIADYLPAFVLGSLASIRAYHPSERAALASVAAFAIAIAICWASPFTHAFLDKKLADPFDRDIFAFLLMLPLLPYVVRSLKRPSDALDRHLGNLSFPLYLAHYPAIAFIGTATMFSKATGVAIGIAVALGAYIFFDRPVDALRQRLFERRQPAFAS